MKSAGKARNNGLYRHIRTSKEIIRNLLNDCYKVIICTSEPRRLIFDYCGAISALPEAFFFGYSGAIFERSRSPFHCLQRCKIYPLSFENRRCTKSTFLSG